MNKRIRIEKALTYQNILAYLFDYVLMCVLTLALYFASLYSIFGVPFSYISNQNEINETYISYNLNYESGKEYSVYEKVIQDFYFNKFSDELVKNYKDKYGDEFTITHVYNVEVLNLPTTATQEAHSTTYYSYYQESDGSFNVDVMATKLEGSGKVYEGNMSDLFYTSYSRLKNLLKSFDENLSNLINLNLRYEFLSRVIAFAISFIILYVIIPLTNKYKCTIFEKIFKICSVNRKNGYLIGNTKLIFKGALYNIFLLVIMFVFNNYSILILGVGYPLVNVLVTILSKRSENVVGLILKFDTASIPQSLIYKSKDEENLKGKENEEDLVDPEFLEKLKNIK